MLLAPDQRDLVLDDLDARTRRPCMMCAAACEFTGVGAVFFIAPDPSDDNGDDLDGIATEWVITANLLFLSSGVAAYSGSSSSMIARAGQREPEITHLMRTAGDTALRQPALRVALAPVWPDIQAAARKRRSRQRRGA